MMRLVARLGMVKRLGRLPVFPILITLAIVINIGQFSYIDSEAADRYKALNSYPTDELDKIGLAVSNSIRQYYMHAFALAEAAPGSKVFIPKDSGLNGPVNISRTYGLGKTQYVQDLDVKESEVLAGFDPEPYIVAFGEDDKKGRRGKGYPFFAIAMETDNQRDNFEKLGYKYSPVRISPQAPIRNNTEFVFLEWEGPKKAFSSIDRQKPVSYRLFVEVSLLPQEIKQDIRF